MKRKFRIGILVAIFLVLVGYVLENYLRINVWACIRAVIRPAVVIYLLWLATRITMAIEKIAARG